MVAEHRRGAGVNTTLLKLLFLAYLTAITMAAAATPNATLDTRLLGKPRVYTNKREDWPGFKCVEVLRRSGVGADSPEDGSRGEVGLTTGFG